ncbi:hypothetical protein Daus18300_004322 [Diaporthe australafricana]|uniref:RRM domain-containing protein n=1 Tax=Diaporthe australafricana TaxID=127596 RepID=A0ABR3X9K1_9PEZI
MESAAGNENAAGVPAPSIFQPGDLTLPQSFNNEQLYQLQKKPFNSNAALWLTHIPSGCTIRELIRAIISVGPTGRILFTRLLPPKQLERGCAAKVVFATREEAQQLRILAQAGKLMIAGLYIWADWHRSPSSSFINIEPISRVVVIEGPSHTVNKRSLMNLFRSQIRRFDTEDVWEHESPAEFGHARRSSVVWRFGSWYDQAELAVEVLQREYPNSVEVGYGVDPCAFPAPAGYIA